MRTLASLLILVLALQGCKKYPEGPAFTLRSKEERLANNWRVDKYFENDVEKTDAFNTAFPGFVLVIVKSGTYAFTYNGSAGETGTWRLANNAMNWETLSNVSGATSTVYTILRLKEKSFWCSTVDVNGIKKEYRYEPQ